jgi:DNA invertase Pin-like site-specific DNA recombinase
VAIITNRGGVWYLPDIVQQYDGRVVLYCRCSERSMVRNGSLERQQHHEVQELFKHGMNLRAIFAGQEYGKLSVPRPTLYEALDRARFHRAILVAADVTRFIRAEAFCRKTNWHAQPTAEEFQQLLEMADGVPLATRLDPWLSNAEVQGFSTKRSKRHGRPPTIDYPTGIRILEMRADRMPFSAIANELDLTQSSVWRFLQKQLGERE